MVISAAVVGGVDDRYGHHTTTGLVALTPDRDEFRSAIQHHDGRLCRGQFDIRIGEAFAVVTLPGGAAVDTSFHLTGQTLTGGVERDRSGGWK